MNNFLDIIEALKKGEKLVCSHWNPLFYFELNKDGDFISSKPNFNASDEKILLEKLYFDPCNWDVFKDKPKVWRRKCYYKSPHGGLEIIWLTHEEIFKIPAQTGDCFPTEEAGEFPL